MGYTHGNVVCTPHVIRAILLGVDGQSRGLFVHCVFAPINPAKERRFCVVISSHPSFRQFSFHAFVPRIRRGRVSYVVKSWTWGDREDLLFLESVKFYFFFFFYFLRRKKSNSFARLHIHLKVFKMFNKYASVEFLERELKREISSSSITNSIKVI